MTLTFAILVALTCTSTNVSSAASTLEQTPDLWGVLSPGPYPVGFRVVDVAPREDQAGAGAFELGHRVFIWYPALPSEVEPLSLADYYRVQAERVPSEGDLVSKLIDDVNAAPGTLSYEQGVQLLGSPLAARRDARAAGGPFPLVLWSARHGVASSQAALVEYLASHGLVVAHAWPLGPTPRMPWDDGALGDAVDSLEGFLTMLDDVLDLCNQLPFVDQSRTAIMGWSYGGESATVFAHRHPEIDILLSFSSNAVGSWSFQSNEAIADLDASQLAMPFLVLSEQRARASDSPSSRPGFLDRIAGDSLYVEFPQIHHGDFRFDSGLTLGRLDLEPTKWSAGGTRSASGYVLAARVAQFALTHIDDPLPVEMEIVRLAKDLPDDFVSVVRSSK